MNHTPKYPGKVWENEYDLGFTREDVRHLRHLGNDIYTFFPWAKDLAERIEALLPPEKVGLTKEDVDFLHKQADLDEFGDLPLTSRHLRSLADRIAALLPPEPKETPQKGG